MKCAESQSNKRRSLMTELNVWSADDLLAMPLSQADLDRLDLAEELTIAARELDAPPKYESGSPVRVGGDALTEPIYWQGRQWAVTPYGVECRDGKYPIQANRLWENDEDYGWVTHMAEKDWVDLPDFAEALRIARRRERRA
jgi:hypothetical protein